MIPKARRDPAKRVAPLFSQGQVKVQETDVRTVECPATLPAGSFRVTFEAFRLRYSRELKLLERPACPGQEPRVLVSWSGAPRF